MNFVISHRQTSQSDSNPVILLRNQCCSKVLQAAPQHLIRLMHNTGLLNIHGEQTRAAELLPLLYFFILVQDGRKKMGPFLFQWGFFIYLVLIF